MTRPWFPFYVGDYLRDTARLSTEAHGAYLLLMLDYWTTGAPPDDDEVLATIARMPVKRWASKIRPALACFFEIESGMWRHKRIDEELARSAEVGKSSSNKAKAAAEARWSKQRGKQGAYSDDAPSMPEAMPQNAQSQSQSQSPQTLPAGESDARAKAREGVGKMVPMDWQPSEANVQVARDAGLNDEQIEAQAKRFRSYNRARGNKFADFDEAWVAWVQLANRAEKPAEKPSDTPTSPPDWDQIASFWVRTGRWQRGYGPEPGMGGCRCPPDILEKHGIDPATGMVKRKGAA